jgi:hypothetical protein
MASETIASLIMASPRLVLVVFCLIGVAAVSGVAAVQWQQSDSLSSLYNAYASYCDPHTISSWNCGFCQHNKGSKFIAFLEDKFTAVFGYVTIFNNEGMLQKTVKNRFLELSKAS